MHVASGGFSGATQVALDLTRGAQDHDALLVLRRKRHTNAQRVTSLLEQGVALELVPGWSHLATVVSIRGLIERWQPDLVVGHGFPEHLLARWAARLAGGGVGDSRPGLVQVEHNMRERYTPFKRWQARQLAPHTAAFVGVSDAVSQELRRMELDPQRVQTIRNGTGLAAFERSEEHPWHAREAAILMAARFGGQKDHETLIRSLVPLRQRHGLTPTLRLAGGGSASHRQACERLVRELGLQSQVEFLGHRADLPDLFMRHRVAALSTHWEGLPLVMAEAMAAGCAVVGSDVAAVREVLEHGRWGELAEHRSPEAWADALARSLAGGSDLENRTNLARAHARRELSVDRMLRDYRELYGRLIR